MFAARLLAGFGIGLIMIGVGNQPLLIQGLIFSGLILLWISIELFTILKAKKNKSNQNIRKS